MEQRLSEGLASLAERAATSPYALDRILRGSPAGVKARSRHSAGRRPTALIVPVLGLAAALLIAVAIAVPRLNQHRGPARQVQTESPPSSVASGGLEPFRAAWLSGGVLYVGAQESPPVAVGTGSNPEWSADGKWLAYLVIGTGTSASNEVRLVRSNGTDNHEVLASPGIAAFMWSPTSDVLAAVPLTASGKSAGLVIARTNGATRTVVQPDTPVDSIMWSQDGRRLAYTGPGGVFTIPASGGDPTKVAYKPPAGAVVILAGWWPGDRGLLLWADPPGAVEADGLALTAVPLGGGPDQVLGTTLVFLRWLTWSPDGIRLAFVAGGGPSPTSGKSIRLCEPPAGRASSWSCQTLAQPAGTVSIDPSWAPDSSQLAFVRAGAAPVGGPYGAFYQSRTLYVASSDGSDAAPLAVGAVPGAGVVLPAWSPNGSQIGYSTGSDIVVVPAAGGRAQVVASALSGSSIGSSIGTDYYGKTPWGGAATWSSGPGSAAAGDA